MNKRPSSRSEREAARAASARRRKLAIRVGVVVAVVVAVVVVVVVLAGGGGDEQAATPEARLARGEELFQSNCATCHGQDLLGTFVGPPLLHEIYAPDQLADDDIRAAVANGVPPTNWDFSGMPAFPNLDSDDVAALIAHIRASQRAAGLAGFDSAAPGSTGG